jgi:hypothetical protein
MKLAIVVALLTGCVATSQVGPYVKHVQRNGDWLVVHKCMIVLEGDELHEAQCTVEQVPLRTVPMMPGQMPPPQMPPQQMPPPQPPVSLAPSTPRAP